MDSKVLTTLAILVGVLAVLYFVTDSKVDSEVEVRTETVSVEESQAEPAEEELTEMQSEEVMPSTNDDEYSEVNMMEEEVHHEEVSEVAPEEAAPEEELTFQKKQFNVSGWGGSDYSSF